MQDNKTHLITEFNNFDISLYPVIDKSISINQYADRRDNLLSNQISRINAMSANFRSSNTYLTLIKNINLSDIDIEKLTILRIIETNNTTYDVYIIFNVGGNEYWGVVKDILSNTPVLKSELSKDIKTKPNEWIIRVVGKLINYIKNWLIPKKGKYICLKQYSCINTINGKQYILDIKSEINVKRVDNNQIYIELDSNIYIIKGNDYIFFNYWNEPL